MQCATKNVRSNQFKLLLGMNFFPMMYIRVPYNKKKKIKQKQKNRTFSICILILMMHVCPFYTQFQFCTNKRVSNEIFRFISEKKMKALIETNKHSQYIIISSIYRKHLVGQHAPHNQLN